MHQNLIMKFIKSHEGKWLQGKGYKKKILLENNDLNSPGTLIQIVAIEPGSEVMPHYHKKMTEVFHILEGEGTMVIEDKTFHLAPGDILTCEPHKIHSAKNTTISIFKYIVFKTNAENEDSYWIKE